MQFVVNERAGHQNGSLYFCAVLKPYLLSFIQLWVFFLSISLSLLRMENQTLTLGII